MKFIKYLVNHHIVRYLVSGGTAAVVNLGLLFILTHYIGFHYLLSGIMAFVCAVFVSFIMQKKWTFQDHSTHSTHKKFGVYIIIALINLGLNTLFLYFFTDKLHIYYMLSQVIASGIVAVWSYFIYRKMFKNDGEGEM